MRFPRGISRTFAISAKEVLHIARDSRVIYLAVGMPLLLLILFGYAVSFDVEHLPMAVVDRDRTPASRRLIEAFTATGIFEREFAADDPEVIEDLFRRGRVKVGLVVPPGYQRDLKRGASAKAQLLVEGADNTTAQIAAAYAAGVAQSEGRRSLSSAGLAGELPVAGKTRVYFNPEMKSSRFIVPGLIAMVVATLAALLTALTVAREWERGSMEQLFATPVGRVEVILGKLFPYLVIGILQVMMLLALGTWLFEVPLRGSLWIVGALGMLFLAGMLAQGLLISVATKNQQVAAQVGVVSTMLPALLLSGFLFPIDNMPAFLRGLSAIIPARYFIDGLRSVLLKGGDVAEVWHDLVALGAFAAVMTTVATLRFRRRIG